MKKERRRSFLTFTVIAVIAVALVIWMSLDLQSTFYGETVLSTDKSPDGKYIAEIVVQGSGFRDKKEAIYLSQGGGREEIFTNQNQAADLTVNWKSNRILLVEIKVSDVDRRYCTEHIHRFGEVDVQYHYS